MINAGVNDPSVFQRDGGRLHCFTAGKRAIDINELQISVQRTQKIKGKYFTISDEKVSIYDSPRKMYDQTTKIFNVSAMVDAEYEKSTFIFFGKMGGRRYIYWGNTGNNDGNYRFGLFEIVGSNLRPLCSSAVPL